MEPIKDFAGDLPWFEEWKRSKGVQPPDFAELRPIPDLPDLLQFEDGRRVRTPSEWDERRSELKRLLQQYIIGHFPESAPAIVSLERVEVRHTGQAEWRTVRAVFDTEPSASFTFEAIVPQGEGPFPVLLAPGHHRDWGLSALSRGYMVILYPGSDEEDQSAVFANAYPQCDWSQIGRRAWLASRTLDCILDWKEADSGKVCIVGHSRYGKQALTAAAIDERIRAVVASSSGTGGACSFRFSSESAFQESAEIVTRSFPEWCHPRLRFFTGREHLLPIDCHGWLGLIAPRHVLLSTAWDDPCESAFAVERSAKAALAAYRLLDAPDAMQLQWRPGGGHRLTDAMIEGYMEWTDCVFSGRMNGYKRRWLFDFAAAVSQERAAEQRRKEMARPEGGWGGKETLLWGLGEAPPRIAGDSPRRGETTVNGGVAIAELHFGNGLQGHLYSRADGGKREQVVIWLHPYAYPVGYKGAYVKGPRICQVLAESGYTVLAFDQLGFGSRLMEGVQFDERFPGWSRLGKMVEDVRSAVDCLQAIGQAKENIYCLGYSLGGMVALYASALDERIAGVASFCGFTPIKSETGKETGGNRKLWEWYGLQPRLGLYENREKEFPYDYQDLLELIAPRPCLLVSPVHDREADATAIVECVASARPAWAAHKAERKLVHLRPDDYNRFQPDQHRLFIQWLEDNATSV